MRIYKPSFGSLAMPIAITVYSAYKLIYYSTYYHMGLGSFFTISWSFLVAIVIGGVLPVILTLVFKAETAEYFLPRLLIFLCTVAFVELTQEFVGVAAEVVVFFYAISSAVTALYFYKIHRTKFSEWFIIFFSTPQLYMMIYHLLAAKDIQRIIGMFEEAAEFASSFS